MSDELSDILGDTPGDPSDGERAELIDLGRLLLAARPTPAAAFRGELGRSLSGSAHSPRPIRGLWPRVAALAVAGVLLLALAGLGVDHHGPLAPGHTAAATASTAGASTATAMAPVSPDAQ